MYKLWMLNGKERLVPSPDKDAFVRRLLELAGNVTQRAFAERIGVPPQYVNRYLRGVVPDPEVLMRIALAYNVTIEWLLGGYEPRVWREESESAAIGRRIRTLREEIGLSRRLFADRAALETATELERYESGKDEAPKTLLESIFRRWNAEYEWLAAETGRKWRRFGGDIVPTIRTLMPSLQDHGPAAVFFRTVEGGTHRLRLVLSAGGREKYYVFAREASPMGGHSSGDLVDALAELSEGHVPIEGKELSPADYGDLGAGNLYAGQAYSRALRDVRFHPLSYAEDEPSLNLRYVRRREEIRKLHLSPEYRRELEERRRADADLVIHDLESKLRYVDRLEDVEDLLKVIGRRVKEMQEKVPLKSTKGI